MPEWNDSQLDRDQIREKKREALVKQAALEFRKRGYHATSMDHIATSLGVTKGALYRYVKSKDEVLFECFMHSNRIGDAAIANAKKLKGKAIDKLASFLTEFTREYLESNVAGGAMVEIDALMPAQRKEVVKGRDRIDQQLRQWLKEGIAEGSVADKSPKLMMFTFMGAINWIPSWFSADGEFSAAEVAQGVSEILVGGIRSRK